MELFVFVRFHARAGNAEAVAQAIERVVRASRQEAGCVGIHGFRSTRDDCLFYIHSRWKDEADFERHSTLPHTIEFIETVERLIDHPVEPARTTLLS